MDKEAKEQMDQSISVVSAAWGDIEEGLDRVFGEDESERREARVARMAQAAVLDFRLAKIERALLEISKMNEG